MASFDWFGFAAGAAVGITVPILVLGTVGLLLGYFKGFDDRNR